MSSRQPCKFPEISAAVIAGGMATRMGGAAKAFLELGGEAILDRQLAVLRPRFAEILVAVGTPGPGGMDTGPLQRRNLRSVEDIHEAAGPLGGLHAALEACTTPWLFAVACDMPFLDGDLIDRMAVGTAGAGDTNAIVPVRRGRPEPLHAFYRASIAGEAARCLEGDRRAMVDLISSVRSSLLRERDLPGLNQSYTWQNLNTPDDLEAAAHALARSGNEVAKKVR
jgi:molybdopterin-guanine dinucleotide biosynthesis protein A